MRSPLALLPDRLRYRGLIGTGGIGSGVFFALAGNHTLGREESRGGRFLDRRDYCKLHIICHYVRALLGPEFPTIPIGKVGDDDVGRRLMSEMREAGLDVRYVEVCPDSQTLFSFCFVYPDGGGGNLTTEDSACSKVNAACVARAELEFGRYEGLGVALAAPEVPLETRAALLEHGAQHGFFRVASFTSAEVPSAIRDGLLRQVDLVAFNLDEAAAAADVASGERPAEEIVREAVRRLREENPAAWVSVTAGGRGNWTWDGERLRYVPAIHVPVENTAGAGDAHLSGIIAGLVAGLPLAEAQQLGTLVSGVSVTSPHTIHPDVNRNRLRAAACGATFPLCSGVSDLLEEGE